MAAHIENMEIAIVNRVREIAYLDTVRAIADPKMFLSVETMPPPAVLVVFDGERAGRDETIGHVLQQTQLLWKTYIIANSFGQSAEGRLGTHGAYQIIEDVIDKLEGFLVDDDVTTSKMLLVGTSMVNVSELTVIYEMIWRNNFIREEV